MLNRYRIHHIAPVLLCWLLSAPSASGWIGPSSGIVQNRGQLEDPVLYYATCGRGTLYFTRTAVVLDLVEEGHAIRMRFEGASPLTLLEPRGERDTRLHYFLGDDPERWKSDIRVYDELVYRDLWPGIDLRLRPAAGQLRYEIVTEPGADRERARFHFEGADRLTTETDSLIRIEIPSGTLLDRPVSPGGTQRVLRWEMGASGREGDRDPGWNDPSTLLWSTLLGGGDNEYAHGLTIDVSGNPIVTGYTRSGNFPTTAGAYDRSLAGSYDVFVAKLDSVGSTLLWATFVGGAAEDRSFGVVLDYEGNPIVAGLSYSSDFPTTPGAYDRTLGGERDAFAAKLSSTGSVLMWSTYLGGNAADRIWEVVLDADDRPIVVGQTYSTDFPTTTGAYDTSPNGSADGFVAKLDASGGSLIWSTFLGGSYVDQVTRVVLGPQQRPMVCGNTSSPDYPTTPGAFDDTHNGDQDCFVSTFDSSGGALLYSTFLGGEGADMGNVLAVDGSGEVVVTGSTTSPDYPVTSGAYDTTHNGDKDIFLTRLDAGGASLVWSTFVGGSATDEPFALVLDNNGCPVLSGSISSSDFPTTPDAFDRSYAGDSDAFLTVLDPSGSVLLWSSYLGGAQVDGGWELEVDPTGDLVITGPTRSPDFPTTAGAYDRTHNGGNDVFLAEFDLHSVTAVADDDGWLRPLWAGPNPFWDAVQVRLELSRPTEVSLLALDANGRRVATVHRGLRPAGTYRFWWDGRDERGRPVVSGVYWLRLEAGRTIAQRRVVCLR